MFTDHGIEHIDSLWDTASVLTDEKFPLNPAEAFVLGGAFLLHDLGMGLASYKDGPESIENDPLFQDMVALNSKPPAGNEAQDPEHARLQATVAVLRWRHAAQAERLLNDPFLSDDGKNIWLLADDGLRAAFGADISSIAQSHWWDVDDLPHKLPVDHGVNADFPGDWEIDPLKLACLLRLADATHIDSRRAPRLLHAFRPQSGVSREHWFFQQRLNRPKLSQGRLLFTSSQSFDEQEARAWWLAHDTLQMIDNELSRVDSLCSDMGKPQFLARGVVGAGTPERLAKYVTARGWKPTDASLRVSRVESVVEKLGGKHLYGKQPWIAVRELIANAADASTALHFASGEPKPAVYVRLYQEAGRYWLEVEDHGIGMTPDSLVGSLTDFGLSGWHSGDSLHESPGLASRGFRARGRFGIGFFSVFMIADRVEVKSLRYLSGSTETTALIFEDGLSSRPLLRDVPPRERLTRNGTIVRARLQHDPLSTEGLFGTDAVQESRSQMLRDMIEQRSVLLDTDLLAAGPEDETDILLVTANEWKTCDARELFRKIYKDQLRSPQLQPMYEAWESVFVEHEQALRDDSGEVVGRAILAAGLESDALADVWWWPSPRAETFVGGLASDTIFDCLGVFEGEPLRADRNSAFPVASEDELRRWASSQAELTSTSRFATAQTRYGAAELARSVGESVPYLPCGYISSGELVASDLADWIANHDEVILIASYELLVFHDETGKVLYLDRTRGRRVELPNNVIVMDFWAHWFFPEEIRPRPKDSRFGEYGALNSNDWNPKHWWYVNGKIGSTALLLEAILESWTCTPQDVAENFHQRRLGRAGDERIKLTCVDDSTKIQIEGYLLSRPVGTA
ncbi:ATP-binding protein [Pseudarthrobacter sp. NIBRBAC000502772]|uniref:HD domain-containing protein n=1 Tax=Pseudarthrobacter sp. NIBRBAC000502772 TaxID=2590775 RepID=UPI00143DB53C|nr:ATP-binding protein [Pseudarthrobacter sp. NIBRBAC000502772]